MLTEKLRKRRKQVSVKPTPEEIDRHVGLKNLVAKVKNKNTPDTDKEEEVLHTVSGVRNGMKFTAFLYATDPMDAMAQYRKLISKEIKFTTGKEIAK